MESETITFRCPECQGSLNVPRSLATVAGPCPYCSAVVSPPVDSLFGGSSTKNKRSNLRTGAAPFDKSEKKGEKGKSPGSGFSKSITTTTPISTDKPQNNDPEKLPKIKEEKKEKLTTLPPLPEKKASKASEERDLPEPDKSPKNYMADEEPRVRKTAERHESNWGGILFIALTGLFLLLSSLLLWKLFGKGKSANAEEVATLAEKEQFDGLDDDFFEDVESGSKSNQSALPEGFTVMDAIPVIRDAVPLNQGLDVIPLDEATEGYQKASPAESTVPPRATSVPSRSPSKASKVKKAPRYVTPQTTTDEAIPRPTSTSIIDDFEKTLPENVKPAYEIFRKFLIAPNWEERIRYIDRPTLNRLALEEYYKDQSKEGPTLPSKIHLSIFKKNKSTGRNFAIFLITTSKNSAGIPVFVQENEHIGYRVAWRPFVEFRDDLLMNFLSKWHDDPEIFHVRMRREHSFGADSPQDSNITSYHISQPIPGKEGFVYLNKRSELATELNKELGWGKEGWPIVQLKWKREQSTGKPYVSIISVPQFGWSPK